jgi:cation transport ATPase
MVQLAPCFPYATGLTYVPGCPRHGPASAGPGRDILVQGFDALRHGRPDMNTLVGLGASASFGISCVAAALPKLGWRTFFEEPAMLLGAGRTSRTSSSFRV